ncbi:MAG: LamG-like jellyroll fold domain-containing protein [Coprobacter fastidiosus]
MYFNGKRRSCAARKNSYNESPIYFGGSNVYNSGFAGVIDDVQIWHKALSDSEVVEAMGGYEDKEDTAVYKVIGHLSRTLIMKVIKLLKIRDCLLLILKLLI